MLEVGANPVKRQLEVRAGAVAFGVKQRDLVEATDGQAEGGGDGSKVKVALGARMHAAQIERQVAVDEDPHVVVAAERQRLAAPILEEVADLGGEAEVVRRGRR